MALLRLALLATVSARSPLETLCDGDRLIVVAGYHHSCTTILQAQLAQRVGLPVPSVRDERWPTDHPREACSNAWSVFRKPLSGLRDVHRFARLRNRFPAARLIFCTRGAPDQIWSLMKRSCSTSPRLATYLAKQRCQVHDKEVRWRQPGARDWTIDLAELSGDPRSFLQKVISEHLASPNAPSLFVERAPRDAPSFASAPTAGAAHDNRRRWQASQPIYAAPSSYERESRGLAPLLRSLGDCANARALPPLSLAERNALSRNNCSRAGRDSRVPAELLFPAARRPRGGYR